MKRTLSWFLLTVFVTSLSGQSSIDWFTLDGGGGAQNSANYLVNSTVGQNDFGSGASTSANYQIIPGFWAAENMGPASSLPELTIVLSGPNVTISWPSPSPGFVLQQSDSLDTIPASWTDTLGAINDNGTIKSITVSHDVAKRFYRLRRNP